MKASGIVALAVSLAASLAAPPARAQRRTVPFRFEPPLVATARSDLSFGTVLPGISESVSPRDQHHAGLFEIQGPRDASVRVELLLPHALLDEHGDRMPIAFGHRDGFADFSHGHPPRGIPFDPHRPVIGALGPNGRLFVWLGGTVSPDRPQAGGTYVATIALTVYTLGS